MITMREARQRASLNNCRIERVAGTIELRVFHEAWTRRQREEREYFTDCIEDAVITAGRMKP